MVSGRIQVEVNEVTRVSAMRLLGLGRAKVEYAKGKQRCRQEAEYLKHEEVLQLDEQPTGEVMRTSVRIMCVIKIIEIPLTVNVIMKDHLSVANGYSFPYLRT